jgi:hypothetical protein
MMTTNASDCNIEGARRFADNTVLAREAYFHATM